MLVTQTLESPRLLAHTLSAISSQYCPQAGQSFHRPEVSRFLPGRSSKALRKILNGICEE
jgi:hypothetical protein